MGGWVDKGVDGEWVDGLINGLVENGWRGWWRMNGGAGGEWVDGLVKDGWMDEGWVGGWRIGGLMGGWVIWWVHV